jgi:hypothetical protein
MLKFMLNFLSKFMHAGFAAWTGPCLNDDVSRSSRKAHDKWTVASIDNRVELLGAPFKVRVYFGNVGGRMACVGLDLRAFTGDEATRDVKPLEGWAELNSPRLRALPIATLVEDMRKLYLDMSQAAQDRPDLWGLKDESSRAAFRRTSKAVETAPTVRSGRPPMLTDDQLKEVVAPAYLSGGGRPVQAVQEALERQRMPGAGPKGEVTIDQARKSVQRARQLGFIPKAAKRGKP